MTFIVLAIVVLYAITIHEYSHGWVAYKLGDNTAHLAGRLTLNPFKHLDLMGTVIFVLLRFGWAKPVPVNAANFREPKRDMMLVGIAGPLSNFSSAFIFGMIFRLMVKKEIIFSSYTSLFVTQLLAAGIMLNIAFAVFNLLPVFPLDGSHILKGLLPFSLAYKYSLYDRQIMTLLFGTILISWVFRFPILGFIIWPPVNILTELFSGVSLDTLSKILSLR